MPRDLSISVSHNKNTVVWLLSAVCPEENEGDVAPSNAHSAHSCTPHSSAFDSEVKPPGEAQPSVCWEGKLFIFLLSSGMVWLRQAASELGRGAEPAGWRDVDWQPSPQRPTGDPGWGPSDGCCSSRVMCALFSQLAAPSLSGRLCTRPQSRWRSCFRPTWRSWGNSSMSTKRSTVFQKTKLWFLNDSPPPRHKGRQESTEKINIFNKFTVEVLFSFLFVCFSVWL